MNNKFGLAEKKNIYNKCKGNNSYEFGLKSDGLNVLLNNQILNILIFSILCNRAIAKFHDFLFLNWT